MDADIVAGDSCLDKFFSEITTNVLRCAFEKVADMDNDIDFEDERALLEQLNQDTLKDSVLNDTSTVDSDLPDIKSECDEIGDDAIYAKCSKLIDDTLSEAYTEIKRILESEQLEMTNDIDASETKLQLLLQIRNSDQIQKFFQKLSVNIIQDVLARIKVEDQCDREEIKFEALHMENDNENNAVDLPGESSNIESDTTSDIGEKQGSSTLSNICQQDCPNMTDSSIVKNAAVVSNFNSPEGDGSLSRNETSIQDSTAELSFYSDGNPSRSMSETGNTAENSSSATAGFTTANSSMFTTANEQQSCPEDEPSMQDFVSFDDEGSQFKIADHSMAESTPTCARQGTRKDDSEIDRTLTSFGGPRQSTPLTSDENFQENLPMSLSIENPVIIFDADDSQMIESLIKTGADGEAITDDESSSSVVSSPGTLSRQSSALGNVTLEFDAEWESGIHGFHHESKSNKKKEEKQRVILHELSFDEHVNLKAPDLLGPVYLAVQDDDENEGDKRKHKLSQSIDDLCEMITEVEDDQDLPLRRRAMSLESRHPPTKVHRKKVPTKDELIKAFQELRDEMMLDKDLDEVLREDDEVEEFEESVENESTSNDQHEGHIEEKENDHAWKDPMRWQTVVFNGQHKVIDLKLLEPFMKVLTHGGYHHDGGKKTVIVVLTACNLPNKRMKRYSLMMEQLFFFIISTMEILVTSDEYIFIYFHGGTDKNQSPGISWLKRYYQHIDRRLRKSVTKVYVVHPNLWLKSVFRLTRPFLSSNFSRKLKFVNSLKELSTYVKTDFIFIPDEVIRADPDYRKIHAG